MLQIRYTLMLACTRGNHRSFPPTLVGRYWGTISITSLAGIGVASTLLPAGAEDPSRSDSSLPVAAEAVGAVWPTRGPTAGDPASPAAIFPTSGGFSATSTRTLKIPATPSGMRA